MLLGCVPSRCSVTHTNIDSVTVPNRVSITIKIIYISAENSSHNDKKSLIIQEIMNKVSSLPLGTLSKASHKTKETVLKRIENKLRKSPERIGPDAEKYINYIMELFKAKINESVTENEKENIQKDAAVKEESVIRRTKEEGKPTAETMDSVTKKEIIKYVANKIESLAKAFMKNAKTDENKKQILDKIKKRILNSTKLKHMQLHNKHAELKLYSTLIAEGLEESIRNLIGSEAVGRRMNSQPKPVSGELIRVEHHKTEKSTEVDEDISKKTKVVMDLEEISKYRDLISQSLNGTSADPRCDEIVEDTCLSIQKINQIPCGNGKAIPVEHLCNNVSDCLDDVDEKNCVSQGKMIQLRT